METVRDLKGVEVDDGKGKENHEENQDAEGFEAQAEAGHSDHEAYAHEELCDGTLCRNPGIAVAAFAMGKEPGKDGNEISRTKHMAAHITMRASLQDALSIHDPICHAVSETAEHSTKDKCNC